MFNNCSWQYRMFFGLKKKNLCELVIVWKIILLLRPIKTLYLKYPILSDAHSPSIRNLPIVLCMSFMECEPSDHYTNYLGKMIRASDRVCGRRASSPITALLTCRTLGNQLEPIWNSMSPKSHSILIQALWGWSPPLLKQKLINELHKWGGKEDEIGLTTCCGWSCMSRRVVRECQLYGCWWR